MIRSTVVVLLAALAQACDDGPRSREAETFSGPVVDTILVRRGAATIRGLALGSGSPVVVLHGGPGMDHSYLLPGLSPLSSQARLVFLDQRGTGMSDAPLDETAIGFPLLLEDIEAVRLALGVDSIGILSHSWGSTLALHYALAYPNHVSSLVLISPVEPGTRFVEVAGRRRSERMTPTLLDSLRLLQQDPAFREGEPTLVNRWYRLVFTPLLSDPERDLDLGIRLSETTTRRGFEVMRLLGPTMPDPDLWGRLGGVRAPVLLVHGRADAYPVEMVLEMADSIEVGRAVVIEDAGHFPYIENPEALRAAVTAFWSGLEASN